MNNKIVVKRNDINKIIYFIIALAQKQQNQLMFGSLGAKSDSIGGIFDRFINLIPESIVFDKGILKEISDEKEVKVISDFYIYDPKKAGIAPDVFGLSINNKTVPFVKYDDGWVAVDGMPQIEVKTFKNKDYMVSLRDQNYKEKYLVLVDSNLRIDYLIPFMDKEIFSNQVYEELLKIDSSVFIQKDTHNMLQNVDEVKYDFDTLGELTILKITRVDKFKEYSMLLEEGISPQWIDFVEKYERTVNSRIDIKLSDLCEIRESGLCRLTKKWYDLTNNKNLATLDFYCSNIDNIKVIKINKTNIYIEVLDGCYLNNYKLEKGIYKVVYKSFDRGNGQKEYFLQKDLIKFLIDYSDELKDKLSIIVKNN